MTKERLAEVVEQIANRLSTATGVGIEVVRQLLADELHATEDAGIFTDSIRVSEEPDTEEEST